MARLTLLDLIQRRDLLIASEVQRQLHDLVGERMAATIRLAVERGAKHAGSEWLMNIPPTIRDGLMADLPYDE